MSGILSLFAMDVECKAAITVYTSEAAFNAAVSSPGVDTFSGFSISGSTASPISRSAGVYSYQATAPNNFFGAGTAGNPWLSTNSATAPITFFNFGPAISAVGALFFTSNLNGDYALGDIVLTVTDGSGTTSETILNSTTSSFRGFVSTGPISSLTVAAVQPGSGFLWPTVDNLTLAQAGVVVPEPATSLLALSGLAAISLRRRRSR